VECPKSCSTDKKDKKTDQCKSARPQIIEMLQCTVCKRRQGHGAIAADGVGSTAGAGGEKQHFDPNFPDLNEDESGGIRRWNKKKWLATKDRTSVSQMRISFKLFDCLKREFNDGFVCVECFDLVEQIDALQFQANELIKDLRNRIDADLFVDDLSDSCESRPLSSTARWRGGGPTGTLGSGSRKRLKRELDDFDDDNFEPLTAACNDDDPDYLPAASKSSSKMIKKEASGSGGSATTMQTAKKKKMETPKVENKRQIMYKSEWWDNVNDPDYVGAVLKKKNFDYEVHVINTVQNTEHLIYDGAIWHQATFREFKTDKMVAKWICGKSHHFSYRCTARVATTADKACVIQESKYMEHNHELDPEEVKYVLLKNRVKEIALNHPEMTPIRVLKTVEMMNEDMNVKVAHSSILKFITRVQDKHGIPRKPRERKPGYVPRKRKTPLTKWKKTPSQLKKEKALELERARKLGEAAGQETDGDELDNEGQSAVQHIIIQQAGDNSIVVQQAASDGAAGAAASSTAATSYTTTTLPQATTFQIEYTGHVSK